PSRRTPTWCTTRSTPYARPLPDPPNSTRRRSTLGRARVIIGRMARLRAGRVLTMALAACVAIAGAFAQYVGYPYHPFPNIPYDVRFTFVRVRYEPAPGGCWPGRRPSWIHGYPLAEQNLMKIMNEVSLLGAHDDINTVTLDDPELFKYPIAYIIEVGWWTVTDREVEGLRAYLQKGGFLFVDDFKP